MRCVTGPGRGQRSQGRRTGRSRRQLVTRPSEHCMGGGEGSSRDMLHVIPGRGGGGGHSGTEWLLTAKRLCVAEAVNANI